MVIKLDPRLDGNIDSIVNLDSAFAKSIGFTSDKFDGYLWRENNRVLISFIISKNPGQGNFARLIKAIESQGLRVAVPTPFPRMKQILLKNGFVCHQEDHPSGEKVDVWERQRHR